MSEMSFDDYIKNPMGKHNAVMSNRGMYANMYTSKWNIIMVRENAKVDYKCFKNKSTFICYIKIPSEVIENFYYDVVIEFTPPKDKVLDTTLRSYNVRFYSNDPSFVYTYAHAFLKNDLFIPWMKDKMSKEAIKKEAKEKNPHNQIGYVKSLYFAYLAMAKRGLFSKTHYQDSYNITALMRDVTPADEKVEARQKAEEQRRLNKRKDRQRDKEKSSKDNTINKDIPIKPKGIVKTKVTSKISTIHKSGTIKKTKRK